MIEPTMTATANQYAPPTATVADVTPEAQGFSELDYFSAKGRIGRLRYLAYVIGASLIQGVVAAVLMFVLGGGVLSLVANGVLYVAMFWFTIITGVKRCHDLNISGWWAATFFIPIIGFVWLFWPGTQGANRFGPPPPPNTTGVRVLAWILPVIFIIGIIAAVAIPAYSSYQMKHRAAQSSVGQP